MSSDTPYIQVKLAAVRAGISLSALCAAADVAPVTVWRWRNGTSPNLATLKKLLDASEALQKGKSSHAGDVK